MKTIPDATLDQSMQYNEYRERIEELRANGKTTGSNHSEVMLNYTDLNRKRMARLDKTATLTSETLETLKRVDTPIMMLVLTEAWCGDAAQAIPVLHKLTEANPALSLKLILRDEHPDIMDAFPTNGGRSIPKVIFINNEDRRVLGTWGPRPTLLQKQVMADKAAIREIQEPEEKKQRQRSSAVEAQKWYAKDKTRSIQAEIVASIAQYQPAPARL